MVFRKALLSDIPVLLDFEQQVIAAEKPFNDAIKKGKTHYYDLPSLIQKPTSRLIVAETQEIIACGYALIKSSKAALTHDKHAYLGFMYTAEKYRGKGINQQIIEKLKSWCIHQGVTNFYLDVYAQNRSAIKAYEKCGFEPSLIEMKLHI